MDTFPSFSMSYCHFPFPTFFFLQMVSGLKGCLVICPNQMCAVALSIQYLLNSFWMKRDSAGGQMKSENPPSLSCHKSCLVAQNKLLLETLLLALYPLPFITSKELQKSQKKKKSPQATCVTPGPATPASAKVHSSFGDRAMLATSIISRFHCHCGLLENLTALIALYLLTGMDIIQRGT